MSTPSQRDVTELLQAWRDGDRAAFDELVPIVYDELRRQAERYMRRQEPGHTLRATALVHEAYLRIVDQRQTSWQSRTHFLGVASKIMRSVLVDHAREKQSVKRGAGGSPVTLGAADAVQGESPNVDVLELDEALTRLAVFDPDRSRLVELRYFTGLTIEETAEVLGVSPATVKRQWTGARAWLRRELSAT